MRVAIAAAVVVVLVASLSGCAVVPRAEKMTAAPSSAALRSIPVELRQNITYLGGDLAFDQALKASLREADLLRESAQRARFRLRAGLVNLEQPSIAVDMTVTASIHYVLEEQSTNKPIFDKTITTSFTEPFSGDALIGFERKKRAGEGAFRANATQLIEELSRLDPPRFPAAPGPVAASPTSTDVSQAAPTTAGTVTPNQNVPDANVLPQTNRGQAGAVCSSDSDCDGTLRCRAQRCEEPPKRVAVTADSRAQTVSRKDEGRKAGTPAAATVASPVKAPPPAEQTNAESGDRPSQLQKTYTSLLEQARAGKMRYLKAARLYEEKVQSLYPEESGNALMNEYLAYMAVIGEKIDQRKLTEAEGQYELARKVSELQERAIAIHARAIAAQQTQQTELARKAREEAAAREVAAQRSLEEQRLALERELAEKQLKQQRADALMQAGILLLAQPWRYAAPLPNAPVTCRWFANNWICQ